MLLKREFVTPQKAEEWLKFNTINRSLDLKRVATYATDMERNRWNFGHDEAPVSDIMFNGNGTLLDGQYRLAAVVQCQKGQWFIVKREMPIESALCKPKKIHDAVRMFCKIKKIPIPLSLRAFCAAMRVAIQQEYGMERGAVLPFSLWLDWFKKNRAELSSFTSKSSVLKNLMSQGQAAGLWFVFARKDAKLADTFFEKLKSGQGIAKGEPVGVLRQRLIAERAKKGRERAHAFTVSEWVIRAWNGTRDGSRWHRLPPNVGGYPEIK